MSELRQNLATREWVIIAPERLKGRELMTTTNELVGAWPEHSENCPFCPGNEERFPNVELDRISSDTERPWDALCLENKYQIFSDHVVCPIEPTEFEKDGIYYKFVGCGNHELVIENPRHNNTFGVMRPEEVESVVRMYIRRFNKLEENPNNLLTIIFKNHGPRSGASQQHPHSQIIASRVVPNHVRHIVDEARRHFDTEGVCVYCKIVNHELNVNERVVFENDHFLSFCPFASPVPYQINIFPKTHSSHFGQLSETEIKDFSECLRATMRKLYLALSNPDFNIIFRNPPYHDLNVPYCHWHVQIYPHIVTPGGFELGSRMNVNVMPPERAAKHLSEIDD